MEEINIRGGARIGIINATWPLARLVVSPARLTLTCVLDSYEFLPKDIVSFKPYGAIPFFCSGIRISHARQDYPSKMIFWCLGNPETRISEIRAAGFVPTAPASSEIRWRGIPLRWPAIIVFILIWNGLFLLNDKLQYGFKNHPGLFTLAPLLFAFLVCWGTKKSPELQKMILREGRSINEVKSLLSLIQTVSAILLVVFVVLLFTGAMN
jgi:hypothetical protein